MNYFMNLSNILLQVINKRKVINTRNLPTRGVFYKDDFEISIRKADMEDIIEYEYDFTLDSVSMVIEKLKRVVEKCAILSDGYTFDDIKSADIVFIFLEIAKFTNKRPIMIEYKDEYGQRCEVEFGPENFNYMPLDNNIMKYYNETTKEFIIDGFRYSVPSIGAENSLTEFLLSMSDQNMVKKYESMNYDFVYFLGHKNKLSYSEIDNLLEVFTNDINKDEKIRIKDIISIFKHMSEYSLKKDESVIEITSKIDLKKIFV